MQSVTSCIIRFVYTIIIICSFTTKVATIGAWQTDVLSGVVTCVFFCRCICESLSSYELKSAALKHFKTTNSWPVTACSCVYSSRKLGYSILCFPCSCISLLCILIITLVLSKSKQHAENTCYFSVKLLSVYFLICACMLGLWSTLLFQSRPSMCMFGMCSCVPAQKPEI